MKLILRKEPDGLRHYLNGRLVHCGDDLEIQFGGVGVPGVGTLRMSQPRATMANDQKSGAKAEGVIGVGSMRLIAEQIARKAHANQFRRDGVTPYITHVEAVANKLRKEHDATIAAAWLHDVLEDTSETRETLLATGISRKVLVAVEYLTKRAGQDYDQYLSAVRRNTIARKVKIADLLHNLSDEPTQKQILKYVSGLMRLVG